MSDICILLYIASMEEGYQLKLKSIKTILKVKGKQALWEEENESKQECLKVCVFYRRRKFQQKKTKKSGAKAYCLSLAFRHLLSSWSSVFSHM